MDDKIPQGTKKCPACGAINNRKATKCNRCFVPLAADDIPVVKRV